MMWIQRTVIGTSVLFGALLGSAVTGWSSEAPEGELERRWALQYRISNDFTLSSFNGAVLSIRRQFSESRALRVGVNFRLADLTEDAASATPDTTVTSDEDIRDISITLSSEYLFFSRIRDLVSPYWGFGPRFVYAQGERQRVSGANSYDGTRETLFFGMSMVLGVEWAATDFLAFHAEYGFDAGYETRDDEDVIEGERPRSTISDRKGWLISEKPVLFGVSVFF